MNTSIQRVSVDYAVELAFTTKSKDVSHYDAEIWGEEVRERWVKFPEFLLEACQSYQQTVAARDFLEQLKEMRECQPEELYQIVSSHQNFLRLAASREYLLSAFRVSRIDNRYITAIGIKEQKGVNGENVNFTWYITITPYNPSKITLRALNILLYEIGTLFYELSFLVFMAFVYFIVFLIKLVKWLIDCFLALFTISGGVEMSIRQATKRLGNQSRLSNFMHSILEFLEQISNKLNRLEEINGRLIDLDKRVTSFNLISEITMTNLDNFNSSVSPMSRFEEIIRENEQLKYDNYLLTEQGKIKDEIINEQKSYIEKSLEEIERFSKKMPSEDGQTKLSIDEIGKFTHLFGGLIEKAKSVMHQTNVSVEKIEGIATIGGDHRGDKTGINHTINSEKSPGKRQNK